jgi:hypothetical protein
MVKSPPSLLTALANSGYVSNKDKISLLSFETASRHSSVPLVSPSKEVCASLMSSNDFFKDSISSAALS